MTITREYLEKEIASLEQQKSSFLDDAQKASQMAIAAAGAIDAYKALLRTLEPAPPGGDNVHVLANVTPEELTQLTARTHQLVDGKVVPVDKAA